MPLTPPLFPLVPRGEREKISGGCIEMRPSNALFPIDARERLRCTVGHDSKEMLAPFVSVLSGSALADPGRPRRGQIARTLFRQHGFATGHARPGLGLGRRR